MATATDEGEVGCTFQWKIENVSHWWWMKTGERIESPTFIADVLGGTKWNLWLYPMGRTDRSFVGFYLHRKGDCSEPDYLKINFQLSFLGKDGLNLKEGPVFNANFAKDDSRRITKFEERDRVFVTEKEAFLPEDTLTARCTIWITNEKPDNSNHLYATSVMKVKRRYFVWRIDGVGTLKFNKRYNFKDDLICFDVVLNNGFDKLEFEMTSLDETIKYISCKTSIIDSNGKKDNCEIKTYFASDLKKGKLSSTLLLPTMVRENKSKYFPNDVLCFDFEFVILKVEHSGCRKRSSVLKNGVIAKEKCKNTTNLNDDLKTMYRDGIFSDMEIRTSTKSFPVHKSILSSRSPVFKSMFSNDMKEMNSGQVEIVDFDDDTIRRMLLYIYTDSLEDLEFESACKLYKIADKYQIFSLKTRCSFFLEDNLSPTNACGVLVLADLYNDDDMKNGVLDFILRQSKQMFNSQEWEDFMSTHLKLAADIMHRKLTKSKIQLPGDA